MRPVRAWMNVAAPIGLLAALALASPAAATRPLRLGFYDPIYTATPASRDPWLQRSANAGADVVRIDVPWSTDVAARPLHPRDPTDPAYDLHAADDAVRAAAAHGLQIMLSFTGAPAWAPGPGRPSDVAPGSWRPDPAAVGDFAAALARRYSGAFPDPAFAGALLPRAGAIQIWNEPNFASYLSPQWSGSQAAAPEIYRTLLNAAYRAVKSVAPDTLVVTAGTAPFGDPAAGGQRMAPARFWRSLLCVSRLRNRLRAARGCTDPAHFDVLAHHPYPGGPPRWTGAADDVSIAELGKLTRILDVARRSGRALPASPRKRLWVTEVSYDSAPPDPQGVPEARHARWLQETLYLLWRQGVDTITWFRILDQSPDPSYGQTNQSGLYRLDGSEKPARRAFRFPFVVEPSGRGRLVAWGRSPIAGVVTIERRRGGRWRRAGGARASAHGTFLVALAPGRRPEVLRARVGAESSMAWRR